MRSKLFGVINRECWFVQYLACFIMFSVIVVVHGSSWASSTPQILCGDSSSLALKSEGTVWAWGYNEYGELGDGTTMNRSFPVQVSELSDVTAITSGGNYSLALKSNGTVWAWGNGITDGLTPIQVNGLSDVTAIAGGSSRSLALKSDGTVWVWGDGTTTDSSTPVQVNELSGIIAIACGRWHSLALKSDGTVWAWGYNEAGQLGDGTTTDSSTPVQVSGLSGITAISGGIVHTIALKIDGTVWAWGYNGYGQLGNGTTTNSLIPVQVNELSGVTAISGMSWHNLALKSDSTVWAWGYNKVGQLGDGTTTRRLTPVQVNGLSGAIAISGGGWGTGYSLALKSDGTVWAWGNNEYGQLGDGTTTNSSIPVQAYINLAGRISISPGSLFIKKLKKIKNAITITVKDEDGNKVAGEKVTAKVFSTGKKLISVTPASQKTKGDGTTSFSIKAKKKTGNAAVIFATESGLLENLNVMVDK